MCIRDSPGTRLGRHVDQRNGFGPPAEPVHDREQVTVARKSKQIEESGRVFLARLLFRFNLLFLCDS